MKLISTVAFIFSLVFNVSTLPSPAADASAKNPTLFSSSSLADGGPSVVITPWFMIKLPEDQKPVVLKSKPRKKYSAYISTDFGAAVSFAKLQKQLFGELKQPNVEWLTCLSINPKNQE